jgi:hypothetical protein
MSFRPRFLARWWGWWKSNLFLPVLRWMLGVLEDDERVRLKNRVQELETELRIAKDDVVVAEAQAKVNLARWIKEEDRQKFEASLYKLRQLPPGNQQQ